MRTNLFLPRNDSEKWEKQRIIKALKNNGLFRTKAAAADTGHKPVLHFVN